MTPKNLPPEEIRRRLQNFQHPPVDPYPQEALPGTPRAAAVLAPLLQEGGEWHLLFIHRATNGHDPHSGQVAFPGGQAEPDDPSPVHTALRETAEEIGLPPEAVTVLGALPPHRTVTNFWVTPVVGHIPWPAPLRPTETEVTRVFTVPLGWLAEPSHRETHIRRLSPDWPPVHAIYFQPYEGEVIWGATARMVLTLLKALEM